MKIPYIDLKALFKKKQNSEREFISLMINSIFIEALENHIDRADVILSETDGLEVYLISQKNQKLIMKIPVGISSEMAFEIINNRLLNDLVGVENILDKETNSHGTFELGYGDTKCKITVNVFKEEKKIGINFSDRHKVEEFKKI